MIPMKKWMKVYGHGRGYIGDMAQVLRLPGAKEYAARTTVGQAAIVRGHRSLLKDAVARVVEDVIREILKEDGPQGPIGDDPQYLLTLHRQEDRATMTVTVGAKIVRVYDLEDVTQPEPLAIDEKNDDPPVPFTPNFTRF